MKKAFLIVTIGALLPLSAQKKESIRRFDDSDLPVVKTKTKFTTLIILPEGEEIAEVTCGDKDFWVVEGKDNVVHVKPAKEGAVTNINIISTNKSIYSFLVQEITKGGRATEKPDLRVELGLEELPKLRKDKADLEDALSRTEKILKELQDRKATEERPKEDPKKKVIEPSALPAPATRSEANDAAIGTVAAKENQLATRIKDLFAESKSEAAKVEEKVTVEDESVMRAYVIERNEGLVQKSSRAVGRFFKRIGRALGIVKHGND